MVKFIIKWVKAHAVFSLFTGSLVIRVLYSWVQLVEYGLETGSDASNYIQFGLFLVEKGLFFTDISNLEAHAGPGYPLLFAIDFLVFDGYPFLVTLTTGLILNALTPPVLFLLTKKITFNIKVAWLVGFWAAFYVHYIRYSPLLNKENLVFFLLPFSILSLLMLKRNEKEKWFFAFLASYLWLIHIDERYLFFLPILLAYNYFSGKTFKSPIIISCLIVAGMLPWLVRNYFAYERPVILTERTSSITDKILGYDTPVNPNRLDRPKDTYNPENIIYYECFVDSLRKGLDPRGKGLKHAKGIKLAMEKGYEVKTYTYKEKILAEFSELIRPVKFSGTFVGYGYRFMDAWKPFSNIVYGIQYGLLLVFMPFGIVYIKKSKEVILLVSLLVFHVVLHLFIGHALQRYRVPIDFVIMIFGLYGMVTFGSRLILKKKH